MKQNTSWIFTRQCRFLVFLSGAVYLVACFAPNTQATDWSTRPLRARVGPNLASNPHFNGTTDWYLGGTSGVAVYDGSVSRTAGSGSIRIHETDDGFNNHKAGIVDALIPVTPGGSYTFSAYAKSGAAGGWPPPVARLRYTYHSATGAYLGVAYQNGRWGNSAPDQWEEMTAFIDVPDEISGQPVEKIKLIVYTPNPVDGVFRDMWIDDMYFGEGKGFEQPAAPKTAFEGKQTRFDDLGNMEVLRNGTTWEPFFPLAITAYPTPPNYATYANQGFNMESRAWSPAMAQMAANAGMMVGYDITGYMVPGHGSYNDLTGLSNTIAQLKSLGLMDDILQFYWDNEEFEEWSVQEAVSNVIHTEDVDGNGDRLHPIFTINDTVGYGRRVHNGLTNQADITGTYIGDDLGLARDRTDGFVILDNIQNQTMPAAYAQINLGVGIEMRPRLFGSIAHGARGLSYWQGTSADPTTTVWWSDFPNMASEIDQMMAAGLIQQPHWTEWSIDTTTEDIDFGTRDLNGEGYLIAANYNDSSTLITFTLDGLGDLGYTPIEIRDFFTDALVATLVGNQFDVTMPANSSGVYRLVAPPSDLGDFDGNGIVDGADFLLWQRNNSVGSLAEWQTHYGTVYSAATAATVPEPATACLLILAALCCGGSIKRFSR